MKSNQFPIVSFSFTCLLILATNKAVASVIVTDDNSEATLSLLNLEGQQGIAHQQVVNDHSVLGVPFFTSSALAGADIAYNREVLLTSELEALSEFVEGGGRLIMASDWWGFDHSTFFDVLYSDGTLNDSMATIIDFANPITNGVAGSVSSFTVHVSNGGLSSSNDDFVILAEYSQGEVALGYLPMGAGDIVFLTDLNTFDDDRLALADNQRMWTNLFDHAVPEPGTLALLCVGVLCIRRRGFRTVSGTT